MITRSIYFGHFLLFALLILVAAGCARQHTIQAKGDSLVFTYRNSEAKKIFLATSQDNFQYHQASRLKGEFWKVRIPLMKEFAYFYIVDGQIRLPDCPDTVLDDFGGKNCFYTYTM